MQIHGKEGRFLIMSLVLSAGRKTFSSLQAESWFLWLPALVLLSTRVIGMPELGRSDV